MNSLFSTPRRVKFVKQGKNNNENRNITTSNLTNTKFQFSPQVLISATATRGQTPVVSIATPHTPLSEYGTKVRSATTKQAATEVGAASILGKRRLPMNMVVSQVAQRRPKSPVRVLHERLVCGVKSEPPPPDPILEQLLNSIKGRQAGKLPHPRELMSARMRKYRLMDGPEDEICKAYTSIYGEDATNKLRLGYQRKDTEILTPSRTIPHSSSYADFVRSSKIKLYGLSTNNEHEQTKSAEAAVPIAEGPRWLGGDAEHESNIIFPQGVLTSQSFLQSASRPQSQSSQWIKYLDPECASLATPSSSPELVHAGEQDENPESAQCHWLYEHKEEDAEEKPARVGIMARKRKREDDSPEHLPGKVYGKTPARVNFVNESPVTPRYMFRREAVSPCTERDDPINTPRP